MNLKFLLIGFLIIVTPQSALAAFLTPSRSIGSVQLKDYKTKPSELQISTGGGSKSVNSLSNWLGVDLLPYGVEGSIALFDFQPGTYEINWQFYTAETDGDDYFLIWDGLNLSPLATSAIATTQQSSTRWRSEWTISQIATSTGSFGLIALDSGDKKGTTIIKVSDIQKVPEPRTAIALIMFAGFVFLMVRCDRHKRVDSAFRKVATKSFNL